MKLPQFQSDSQPLQLMQNSWASLLEPIVSNPANQSVILPNISLATGSNTINHRLGRKLQGWKIIRQNASATFYDAQDNNKMPELTLVLISSADVTVSLEVF